LIANIFHATPNETEAALSDFIGCMGISLIFGEFKAIIVPYHENNGLRHAKSLFRE
jgi:hypothetical protein